MINDTFKICFSKSNSDKYQNTSVDDIILQSTKPMHIGIDDFNDCNASHITITNGRTQVHGDLQLFGYLLDSNNVIMSTTYNGTSNVSSNIGGGNSNFLLSNGIVENEHIKKGTITLDRIALVSGGGDHFVSSFEPHVIKPSIGGGITMTPGQFIHDSNGDIYLGTTHILDASVTEVKLADMSVTSDKITSGAIMSDKIADGQILNNHILNGSISGSKLLLNTVNGNSIIENTIDTKHVKDAAITANKIDNNAVSTIKIQDKCVTNQKLADLSITNNKIQDSSITKSKVDSSTGTGAFVLANEPTLTGNVGIDGTSHSRLIIDKDNDNDTSSVIFTIGGASIANGWGEIGITSDKDMHFKANPDMGTYIDRMVIKHDTGNVGIGTNNPNAKLDVYGDISLFKTITANQNGPSHGKITWYSSARDINTNASAEIDVIYGDYINNNYGWDDNGSIIFRSSDAFYSPVDRMIIRNNGNIGIGTNNPTAKLDVNGILKAGNIFSNDTQLSSDDRIKSDEVFITNALDTINRIHPQEYNKWNTIEYNSDSNAISQKESGIIAQELYIDAPELRHLITLPIGSDSNSIEETASNYASYNDLQNDPVWPEWSGDSSNTNSIAYINYTGLIPYTIQAIKELSDKLDAANNTIASYETIITNLQIRIDALEKSS